MKTKVLFTICILTLILSGCGTKEDKMAAADQISVILSEKADPTLSPVPTVTPIPTPELISTPTPPSTPEPTEALMPKSEKSEEFEYKYRPDDTTVTPAPETDESVDGPMSNEVISEALTTYMYESFGGFGNEEFAASWYEYIDYWKVFRNVDRYAGFLYLKDLDDEPSMDDIKHMSMAAIVNFDDVRIESMDVIDHDGTTIGTYVNPE